MGPQRHHQKQLLMVFFEFGCLGGRLKSNEWLIGLHWTVPVGHHERNLVRKPLLRSDLISRPQGALGLPWGPAPRAKISVLERRISKDKESALALLFFLHWRFVSSLNFCYSIFL